MFGNKKQKEQRTLKKYDEKKVQIVRKKTDGKRAKGRHFFSRFMFYFLILVFLGTTGYLIFFSGFLDVLNIEIQGNEIVKSADVEKIVDSKLEGRYFNFLEKNNLVLLNGQKIKNELLENFKIISRVEVKKNFPNGVKISIFERKPRLILDSAGKDWVIDENGKVFDEAGENFSYLGRDDFPIIFDESNKELFLGSQALGEEYISFITDFRKKAGDEMGIEFEREIKVPSISSGDVRMKTKEGWMIFLDESLGADKEKEMLQAVLDNKIAKEGRPNLEYIDLRIPNKVFYKFKEGTPEAIAKETADKAAQDSANAASAPASSTSKKDDAKKKK